MGKWHDAIHKVSIGVQEVHIKTFQIPQTALLLHFKQATLNSDLSIIWGVVVKMLNSNSKDPKKYIFHPKNLRTLSEIYIARKNQGDFSKKYYG
mgnify:CR=1 FL=1